MAFPTYTTADFKGYISLPSNTYGEQFYMEYIGDLKPTLFAEYLGAQAMMDIRSNDRNKWAWLFVGGEYTYFNNEGVLQYGFIEGLNKIMLIRLYFEIVKDDFTMGDTGATINYSENSRKVSHWPIARDRWNRMTSYWNDIYDYFKRVENITYEIASSVETAGEYEIEITVNQATMLGDGEIIYIDNEDYQIFDHLVLRDIDDNVIGETFKINAATGLTFTSFIFKPYEIVKAKIYKYITL